MEVLVKVQTFTPFPAEAISLVWDWMNEFPLANFDDYGPNNLAEFVEEMADRSLRESSWIVLADGDPVGYVGYIPITQRLGTFHGICFTKRVHGSGVAHEAIASILRDLYRLGVEKVAASFFSDNLRVGRFLTSLGAVDEGLLREHTLRNGEKMNMRVMAFFKEAPCLRVV